MRFWLASPAFPLFAFLAVGDTVAVVIDHLH